MRKEIPNSARHIDEGIKIAYRKIIFIYYLFFLTVISSSSIAWSASHSEHCQNSLMAFFAALKKDSLSDKQVHVHFDFLSNQLSEKLSKTPEASEFLRDGLRKLETSKVKLIGKSNARSVALISRGWINRFLRWNEYKNAHLKLPKNRNLNDQTSKLERDLLKALAMIQMTNIRGLSIVFQNPFEIVRKNHEILTRYFLALRILDPSQDQSPQKKGLFWVRAVFGQLFFGAWINLLPSRYFGIDEKSLRTVLICRLAISWVYIALGIAGSLYGAYTTPYIFEARMQFMTGDKILLTPNQAKQFNKIVHILDLPFKDLRKLILEHHDGPRVNTEERELLENIQKELDTQVIDRP